MNSAYEKKGIIRCRNLTLGYGRDVVLENVNLEIPQGSFFPFIGPNGGGKTTLLRGILGLLKPLSGSLETPFAQFPAGYVPQHKAIDPLFPVTVREIAAMGLYPKLGIWKKPGTDDQRWISQVLDELSLLEHQKKNFRDLSGGLKQKVLIARAMVSRAEVFIMDEPTSELDEHSENEVLKHLEDFVTREGKTVLMVHHGLRHPVVRRAPKVCVVHHRKVSLMETSQMLALGEGGF